MAPDTWSSGEALAPHQQQPPQAPSQPQPPHQDPLDRQIIRHLLNRYSKDEIARLVQEETQSPVSHDDGASVFTSSTYSSVRSDDAPSLFDSASSTRAASDTTSSRSSIISNVSARTAKLLGRKTQSRSNTTTTSSSSTNGGNAKPAATANAQSAAATAADDATWDTDDAASAAQSGDAAAAAAAHATKQKGAFMCGFCGEEGIQKTCTRKNDLKRHMEDFHNMDAQWFCRHRGCQMVFDWQTAYKTHLKHSHGGPRMSLDEARVDLCPQTVFACGFEHCPTVLEAPSDADAPSVFKEYVAHVVKHFDEGAAAGCGEWSYSARIRNLLRQSGVLRAWTNAAWPDPDRRRLVWHPQTSGVLRKRLETRHVGDLQLLIQYAIALGSGPAPVAAPREDFVCPVRDQCQMMIPGHKTRAQPQPLPPSQPTPDGDPFTFKISRNPDPSLRAYIASQRRVVVPPRPPVRSGRSARPPMNSQARGTPTPSPMTPQYSTFGGSPSGSQIFHPHQQLQQQQQQHYQQQQQQHGHHPQQPYMPQQQQQQQQHHPQQQFGMMPQVHGGIVAEDLRSLQSMAGTGTPEPDLDMGDAPMMDTPYVGQHHQHHQQQQQQQHDFAAPYGGGLQSPVSTDACGSLASPQGMELEGGPHGMEQQQPQQHNPFGAYEAPQQHY